MRKTAAIAVFAVAALVLLDATGLVTLKPRAREGVPAVGLQIELLGTALDGFRSRPLSDDRARAGEAYELSSLGADRRRPLIPCGGLPRSDDAGWIAGTVLRADRGSIQ